MCANYESNKEADGEAVEAVLAAARARCHSGRHLAAHKLMRMLLPLRDALKKQDQGKDQGTAYIIDVAEFVRFVCYFIIGQVAPHDLIAIDPRGDSPRNHNPLIRWSDWLRNQNYS